MQSSFLVLFEEQRGILQLSAFRYDIWHVWHQSGTLSGSTRTAALFRCGRVVEWRGPERDCHEIE